MPLFSVRLFILSVMELGCLDICCTSNISASSLQRVLLPHRQTDMKAVLFRFSRLILNMELFLFLFFLEHVEPKINWFGTREVKIVGFPWSAKCVCRRYYSPGCCATSSADDASSITIVPRVLNGNRFKNQRWFGTLNINSLLLLVLSRDLLTIKRYKNITL